MLKVLLAQHIEPRFLCAPRLKIHNASELALAAGVSQVSASRLVRQLEAEGFLVKYADQLKLVRIQDLLEESGRLRNAEPSRKSPAAGSFQVTVRNNSNPRSVIIKPITSVRIHPPSPAMSIHHAFAWGSLLRLRLLA
jgi:hypothetical protein